MVKSYLILGHLRHHQNKIPTSSMKTEHPISSLFFIIYARQHLETIGSYTFSTPPPPIQQKSLKNFVTLWSKHIVLQNGSFTDFKVLFPAVVMDFLFH